MKIVTLEVPEETAERLAALPEAALQTVIRRALASVHETLETVEDQEVDWEAVEAIGEGLSQSDAGLSIPFEAARAQWEAQKTALTPLKTGALAESA